MLTFPMIFLEQKVLATCNLALSKLKLKYAMEDAASQVTSRPDKGFKNNVLAEVCIWK
jgi:hypothetical protein